ncbi:hypothetical protein [Thalassospira sp.]
MALKTEDLKAAMRQFDDYFTRSQHLTDALVRAAGLEPAKP